ncbi:hypothetical protein Tco_0869954 [Tanacetum coccineum]
MKEVDGETIMKLETKMRVKDGIVSKFPRKFHGYTPSKQEEEEPEKKESKEAPEKGPNYEFLSYAVSDSDSDLESTARSGPKCNELEDTCCDNHDLSSQPKCFNLAYYMAKRMASVFKSDLIVLPYAMLLTRLYMHVLTMEPCPTTDAHYLVDHVMVPLTKGRAHRFMVDGKRSHPQTSSGSSSSQSLTPTQGEVDPVDNFTLDPIVFFDQLPPILRGASEEFKQTKGMLKCFGHFLSNLGKKK